QYFRDYPRDRVILKLAVSNQSLFDVQLSDDRDSVGDVVHTLLLAQALHHYTIENFGDFTELDVITGPLIATAPLAGILALVVRSHFCFRIRVITDTWIYAAGCWFFSLGVLILDSLVAVGLETSRSVTHLHNPRSQNLVLATLCVGAGADWLITGFMCMGLLRARGSSEFSATRRILDKLVAFTIGTGLLTSLMGIAEAIAFGRFKSYIFLAFRVYCIIPKLMSNSLFASLNARSYFRDDDETNHFGSSSNGGRLQRHMCRAECRDSVTFGISIAFVSPDLELGADGDSVHTAPKSSSVTEIAT
ncbi:hypothetical protein EXIGLDRAFT_707170, partial [Exidia glandulosa HHB12029]